MIGEYNESDSSAILRWMETFSFNDQFKDRNVG